MSNQQEATQETPFVQIIALDLSKGIENASILKNEQGQVIIEKTLFDLKERLKVDSLEQFNSIMPVWVNPGFQTHYIHPMALIFNALIKSNKESDEFVQLSILHLVLITIRDLNSVDLEVLRDPLMERFTQFQQSSPIGFEFNENIEKTIPFFIEGLEKVGAFKELEGKVQLFPGLEKELNDHLEFLKAKATRLDVMGFLQDIIGDVHNIEAAALKDGSNEEK
jgi:hypothetical protein